MQTIKRLPRNTAQSIENLNEGDRFHPVGKSKKKGSVIRQERETGTNNLLSVKVQYDEQKGKVNEDLSFSYLRPGTIVIFLRHAEAE